MIDPRAPGGDGDDDDPTHARDGTTATHAEAKPARETEELGPAPVAPQLRQPRRETLDDLELPPRFEARRIVGRGAMGIVVEALDRNLGRNVAVKFLAASRKGDPAYRVRFQREARAAAMLRHPNIVTVYDVDPERDLIVMELVEGESLSARLRRERQLPLSEVRRIGRALLDALAAAHDAKIVHRDIKPGNILIETSGAVKLVDFGIASFGDRDLTSSGVRIGTPAYMAPEQLRGRIADARADIYAVGATLFEAATGMQLHSQTESTRDVTGAILAATGDASFAAAIARATADVADERFQDARTFATALEETVAAIPGTPIPGTPIPGTPLPASVVDGTLPPATPRRRLRVTWILIPALAIAAGVIAALLLRPRADTTPVTAKPPVVAVLPFLDHTREPRLDFAASGLAHILGTELERVPELEVADYYKLLDRVGDPAAPRDRWIAAARALGADSLLTGELRVEPTGIRLAIELTTIDGAPLGHTTALTTVDEVPAATRAAASEVARTLLGRATPIATADARRLDVERELQLGIAALHRQDFVAADGHLERAVLKAPDLAEIHYYRALLDWWQSRNPDASITAALAGKLEDSQRGFLEGLRLLQALKHREAIDRFRELATRFPEQRDIDYGLFEALYHGGHPAEAMVVYRRLGERHRQFRLGLTHTLDFALAHGDADTLAWALGRLDPEQPDYVLWQARAMIARRDYASAIELLRRHQVEQRKPGGDLERMLVEVYVLAGQLELAVDLAGRWTIKDAPLAGMDLLGLAKARGRAEDITVWRGKATNAIDLLVGETRERAWWSLADVELPDASRAQLQRISKEITAKNRMGGMHAGLLIAGATNDTAAIDAARASTYPEIAAIASALSGEAASDWKRAGDAWRTATEHTSDGRFVNVELFGVARAAHAANDPGAVLRACDDVIHPRVFTWTWGSTAPTCLRWSAEAATALGRTDAAREHWQQLLALRSKASANDPLAQAAKAGLAALPPR